MYKRKELKLKIYCTISFFCFCLHTLQSQSLVGVTGKADTSFTNYSAWLSAIKKYPFIKVVQPISSSSFVEKKNIVYIKYGERVLLLDVFSPKVKPQKKKIVILILHGGGWRSGNRAQHYPMAQRLAQLGYSCITPAYSLSTDALFPTAIDDVNEAIQWVKKNATTYNFDTAKIAILGFSAGGELAAYIGATNTNPTYTKHNMAVKNSIKAVIDIDGILSFVHPESGEGDDSKKISAATYWFGYAKKDNPTLWNEASALTYTGKYTPPTLFINSAVERMHAGRNDYVKILTENNIYTEVKSFENSPHTFCLFHPWFDPTLLYIDDFLKKVFTKKNQ